MSLTTQLLAAPMTQTLAKLISFTEFKVSLSAVIKGYNVKGKCRTGVTNRIRKGPVSIQVFIFTTEAISRIY